MVIRINQQSQNIESEIPRKNVLSATINSFKSQKTVISGAILKENSSNVNELRFESKRYFNLIDNKLKNKYQRERRRPGNKTHIQASDLIWNK